MRIPKFLALSPLVLVAQCAPQCAPAPVTAPPITVTHVVDGDTVDVSTGERVRIIGIDTPEVGECGYDHARLILASLVEGQTVSLVSGARDGTDRYGRILRYIDTATFDAGRTMIERGLAVARYDSRDGYGAHTREADYLALDAATAPFCPSPAPGGAPYTPPGDVTYANCAAVRAAGKAPIRLGEPGYGSHLDRDGDGVGCE